MLFMAYKTVMWPTLLLKADIYSMWDVNLRKDKIQEKKSILNFNKF